jgi:hypothetical protein
VTPTPPRVRVTEDLRAHLRKLPAADTQEILAGIARLRAHSLPKPGNGVHRVQISVPGAPRALFYTTTAHFGLLHTVMPDGTVWALSVHRRPSLRLPAR